MFAFSSLMAGDLFLFRVEVEKGSIDFTMSHKGVNTKCWTVHSTWLEKNPLFLSNLAGWFI